MWRVYILVPVCGGASTHGFLLCETLHKKEAFPSLLLPPAGGLGGKGRRRRGIKLWRLLHKMHHYVNPSQEKSFPSLLLPPPAGGLEGKKGRREREGPKCGGSPQKDPCVNAPQQKGIQIKESKTRCKGGTRNNHGYPKH